MRANGGVPSEREGDAMLPSSAVTVVVNGAIVSSALPARIRDGRVVAPLYPVVTRLAARVAYLPGAATIAIEHAGRRITIPVAFVEDDVPYIALGPVVRAVGASAAFDGGSKTLSIVVGPEPEILTPAPYVSAAPAAVPATVFTPAPPAPTPRTPETGVPHPRRTAIPAAPSEPVPAPGPTDPRR